MTTLEKKHITPQRVAELLQEPGELSVRIHRLNGYHVPFVFHTAPGATPVGYGPIADDGSMIAAMDLAALVEGLKESYGEINILIQNPTPAAAILH